MANGNETSTWCDKCIGWIKEHWDLALIFFAVLLVLLVLLRLNTKFPFWLSRLVIGIAITSAYVGIFRRIWMHVKQISQNVKLLAYVLYAYTAIVVAVAIALPWFSFWPTILGCVLFAYIAIVAGFCIGIPIKIEGSESKLGERAETASHCAAALAVIFAAGYFLVGIEVQKTFQRLSIQLRVTELGTKNKEDGAKKEYMLECKITNKADVRIDLDACQVTIDGKNRKNETYHFEKNQIRDGEEIWSIDANSTATFVLRLQETIDVKVEIRPRWTRDTYVFVRQIGVVKGNTLLLPRSSKPLER